MRAARFHDKGDIRVEEVPVPTPKAGQVLVEIEWCGICGTDLHEYIKGPMVIPQKDQPHSLTHDTLPITLGHEFVGTINKVPEGSKLGIGQHVVVDPRLNCSSCYDCTSQASNLCKDWGFLGLHGGGGGGFSEVVAVDEKMCYELPDSIPLREAVVIEPLVVGRHALTVSGIKDFRSLSVLVLGGGPVGLSTMYNLRAVGAGKVFVSEPTAVRQEYAKELADEVFNPLITNIGEQCRARTDGRGVDIVFDCAGVPAGMRSGMDAVRRRGLYVNVAGWEEQFVLPMQHWMLKEIILRASMGYDEQDFAGVVQDYIAGKFKGAQKMITSRIALEHVKSKGFEELMTNRDLHCKIVATPKPELLTR